MKSVPLRRQSRELALQVLFQQEFDPSMDFHVGLEIFRKNFAAPLEVWNYAELLLSGIEDKKKNIDHLISTKANNWSIGRMALVDINLMRIAVFEMLFSSEIIPPAVAINEAMEITKKYGTNDSAKFINAILDQIVSHGA